MADMIELQNDSTLNEDVLVAYNAVPYSLITAEVGENASGDVIAELSEICSYYRVYKKGAKFTTEGTSGDYVPATLKYKMASSLINKEARFLFAEQPDIIVEPKGDVGKTTKESLNSITILNDLIRTILDKNNFEDALLKAAKDCFIGKRVACVVNFNEEDGVTIRFMPSTQFIYETKLGNPNVIEKFVGFFVIKNSRNLSEKRIFKKKYTLENEEVYLEESIYDGAGRLIDTPIKHQKTLLKIIPVCIIINDGLTGETDGESEIDCLQSFESWYSKMSCGDLDAGRKSMNPIRYAVDMDTNSTKNLSSSAGSFWDLVSDQNLEDPHPMLGMLESSMSYSDSLKSSLDRIKTTGYEQVDMPNITLESLQGAITSGKSLKAIYWPLLVRCKEKMKVWSPQLRRMVDIIIHGSLVYPNCVQRYTNDVLSAVDYEVKVDQNTPLPEDEIEEKEQDLSEVDAKVMSRKAYMKKWRQLTDDEVDAELTQIAKERQIIEDSSMGFGEDVLGANRSDSEPVSEPEMMDGSPDELETLRNENMTLRNVIKSLGYELDE